MRKIDVNITWRDVIPPFAEGFSFHKLPKGVISTIYEMIGETPETPSDWGAHAAGTFAPSPSSPPPPLICGQRSPPSPPFLDLNRVNARVLRLRRWNRRHRRTPYGEPPSLEFLQMQAQLARQSPPPPPYDPQSPASVSSRSIFASPLPRRSTAAGMLS